MDTCVVAELGDCFADQHHRMHKTTANQVGQRIHNHWRDVTLSPGRWAWQSIPVLQLPPVQPSGVVGSVGSTNEESSRLRPRSLVAKVESRVLQVKEDNGVESALRAAEEILRQRRRWEDYSSRPMLSFWRVILLKKLAICHMHVAHFEGGTTHGAIHSPAQGSHRKMR